MPHEEDSILRDVKDTFTFIKNELSSLSLSPKQKAKAVAAVGVMATVGTGTYFALDNNWNDVVNNIHESMGISEPLSHFILALSLVLAVAAFVAIVYLLWQKENKELAANSAIYRAWARQVESSPHPSDDSDLSHESGAEEEGLEFGEDGDDVLLGFGDELSPQKN